MVNFARDLRSGFRLLRRAPGFAVTAILTLALGIGATTALFTVVNAVLLDPLPFPGSNRLIQVWRSELPALTYGSASYARYLDWRQHQRVFTDLGAFAPRGVTMSGPQGPERLSGATASAAFFTVIDAPPVIGRYFSDEEDRMGGERVVVISEGLWKRRFQASSAALGSSVQVDGEPYTVIGVAPSGFSEIWRLDVWLALGRQADPNNRGSNFLMSFGRWRDGMTVASARTGLADLAAQMSRAHAIDKYTFTARPLHEVITENARRGLLMLLGATGLSNQLRSTMAQITPYVALAQVRTFGEVVANANRTSGMLSWLSVLFGVLAAALAILGIYSVMSYTVAQRERELAIRAAVGATRSSLLSMVLREGLLLSGAGIAAGAVIAFAASGVLRSLLYDVSATDPIVFAGSAIALAGIALAGYLVPAARAARVEPVTALRSE